MRAGRGKFGRFGRDCADDADLLAADIENDGFLDAVADFRLVVHHQVGCDDGELRLVEEGGERAFSVIEFVIADRHGVDLHIVEEFDLGSPLVRRVEQRTLEIVAGIEQQDILTGKCGTTLVDCGLQPRCSAEAFIFAFFRGRASGVELVDQLHA